jgi:hypothetical protein
LLRQTERQWWRRLPKQAVRWRHSIKRREHPCHDVRQYIDGLSSSRVGRERLVACIRIVREMTCVCDMRVKT